MNINLGVSVDPDDTPTIRIAAPSSGNCWPVVELDNGIRLNGFFPTGPEFADWLRVQADRVDLAWWQWLDENATTYRFDEATRRYTCCEGYFEHFDGCNIRAQIDTARRSLAKRDADREHAETISSTAAAAIADFVIADAELRGDVQA